MSPFAEHRRASETARLMSLARMRDYVVVRTSTGEYQALRLATWRAHPSPTARVIATYSEGMRHDCLGRVGKGVDDRCVM